MARAKAKVVLQLEWVAIKETTNAYDKVIYDIYQWDIFKMKWMKVARSSGWSKLVDATISARLMNVGVQTALDKNREPPKPIGRKE